MGMPVGVDDSCASSISVMATIDGRCIEWFGEGNVGVSGESGRASRLALSVVFLFGRRAEFKWHIMHNMLGQHWQIGYIAIDTALTKGETHPGRKLCTSGRQQSQNVRLAKR